MKLIYSEKFLEYKEIGHPESPERLKAIIDFLKRKGIEEFIEPSVCSKEDLLLVHSEEHIRRIEENDFFDPDTPNIPGIYEYAILSVGSAIMASEFALNGEVSFSLARPPGHHAGKNSVEGFCYFNNMAIVVKKLLLLNKKVAVIDLDGHHGNGTQEILKDEKGAIYISIHQYPAYPGTGTTSFRNCYNFPLPPKVSGKKYMEKFHKAIGIIKEFSPDIIGVSLGFDAHHQDPLLELPLTDSDYYVIGKEMGKLKINFFVLLEGGYNILTIGNSCYCFLKGVENGRDKESKGE